MLFRSEGADLSGAHSGLAGMYMAKQDSAKALEYAAMVVDAKPESCTSHRLLGQAQALAGQNTQAIATLSTAGSLYETWTAMDLETRDELAEAALENPELDKQIQSHACFDVWGLAAQAALEIGDFEQVARSTLSTTTWTWGWLRLLPRPSSLRSATPTPTLPWCRCACSPPERVLRLP